MKRGMPGIMEFFCVAALLTLFGAGAFTLVSVGADSYSNLTDTRESASDMRVASSYLSMKVRRCDEAGAASVRREGAGDVLVFTNAGTENELTETRIYLYEGMLYEALCSPDDPFEPEFGFEVVSLEKFEVGLEGNKLTFTLKRADLTRKFSLVLRGAIL